MCGKVNLYRDPGGAWASDPDCSSGCSLPIDFGVSYCNKFWGTAAAIQEMTVEPGNKPFQSAGCSGTEQWAGQHQYVCCIP